MKIGGLIKNSLIDYPGKVSCIVFLSGCNFRCPYCHNPELAKGVTPSTGYLNEDEIFDFLEKHNGFLDGVVISGGEPTLQEGLITFCEKIRLMGYPVKLDTNGSRPEAIRKLINKDLVNYIAMDIKTDQSRYHELIKDHTAINDILLSMRIIKESNIDYEFRTTCIKSLVNKHFIRNMSCEIKGSKFYALQKFNKTKVLYPEFFTDESEIYSDEKLLKLKSVMKQFVNKCVIR